MANMPDAMEVTINAYLMNGDRPAALTLPMTVVLLSAVGGTNPDTAGTPIANTAKPLTTTGTNPRQNDTVIRWTGLANPTVVAGFRIQDSNATTPVVTLDNIPVTGGSKTVVDGIFEIPAGGLTNTTA